MNIAIILASGIGQRMNSNIPKQYLKIGNKTVLEHTFLKFYNEKKINKILLVINRKWINETTKILNKYLLDSQKVFFCYGGKSRNQSILNAINFLKKNFLMNDEDIIITHDANRIFVSNKIINENIKLCKEYNCVLTGIKSNDSIYKFKNKQITNYIDRDLIFKSQTPQTFKYKKIVKIINENIENKIFHKTDLGTLAYISNEKIFICYGNALNFKITNNEDLEVARKIINK